MTTAIIEKGGWNTLIEYPFLIAMRPGDIVEHKEIEYTVDFCLLETENDRMCIVVEL